MAGVGLTGEIVPLNGANFPVFSAENGKGGYRTVQSIAARNALVSAHALFLTEGMLVYVRDTQCLYELNPDLATWSFYDASTNLWNQAAWEVNGSTGNDANSGVPGSPIRTIAELNRRISPGYRECIPSVDVQVNVSGVGLEELNLNLNADVALFGRAFIVTCAVTASATMTLTAVVNTQDNIKQRGQLTVGSGAFTNNLRIRALNGANPGSICYSMGQNANAQNHFVSPWYDTINGSIVNIANGVQVVVDTLTVTFSQVNVQVKGGMYFQLENAIVKETAVQDLSAIYLDYFVGCEVSGGMLGNVATQGCRQTGVLSQFGGFFTHVALCIQGEHRVYNGAAVYADLGCTISGGNVNIGGNVSQPALGAASGFRISTTIQIQNGTGTTCFKVAPGGVFVAAPGGVWGNSAPYAVGVDQQVGSLMVEGAANTFDFPCTIQLKLAGQNFAFADMPIEVGGAAALIITGDPNAVSSTRAPAVYLTPVARTNIGATNLFTANPRKGLYRFQAYAAVTTVGTLGTLQVNAIFTDDSGVARTVPLFTVGKDITSTGGLGADVVIETNGATQVQYSVTGITTPGTLQYSLRVNCAIESPG